MTRTRVRSKTSTPWAAPLLRWAGSKRRILGTLLAAAPARVDRYIEPFAGSACLFFAMRPRAAVLGDINTQLIDTYKIIQKHPRLVYRTLSSWRDDPSFYYDLRARNPKDFGDVARAARFVYLNRHCFNGVYRINRAGRFNVPRGIRTGQIPSERHFYRCSVALREAQFVRGDFEKCLSRVRPGDFVYLDPPYAVGKRPTHGEYGYDAFESLDLPRLKIELKRIDKSGAAFLLSYAYQRDFIEDLSPWHVKRVQVQRHVAGFAEHRRGVYEILASNRPFESDRDMEG